MMRKHHRTLLALFVLICAGRVGAQEGVQAPVARVGEPQKVCQLTGDMDWESGRPTAARTLTNFGLDAVDLGYPVDHNGKLILLFGDSWPAPHGNGPLGDVIPDDAVGVTERTALPNPESCLDLVVHSKIENHKKTFKPATITGPVKVKQGWFNVPSGGVSVRGALYAFFWTDHCRDPNELDPSPENPLRRPAPTEKCPETDGSNSVGRGVMARSHDGGNTFGDVVAMPRGFVYSTAVNTRIQTNLPEEQKLGVFIFGVPRYRASVPYLAYAPIDTMANPATWRFFAGRTPDGKPRWVGIAEWRPGPGNQIYTPAFPAGNNVGEFSITWNVPLQKWLMMYGGVAVRVAPAPWGPWSAPTALLGADDRQGCKLLMTSEGCGRRRDYWPNVHPGGKFQPGGFYAPFVMNRYTRAGEVPRSATVYWTLSTWNPYEVLVMRATIALLERPGDAAEGARIGNSEGSRTKLPQ